MRKLIGFAVLLVVLIYAITANRPLEAKDKDELVELKAEVLVLQKQLRDIQESTDKNSAQVATLLNQVVDNISVTRRDIGDTRSVVNRSLSDITGNTGSMSQQLTQLNERFNVTDTRIERLEVKIKELKDIFGTGGVILNCDNGDQQFNQAYADYLRGNYQLAIAQFRNYTKCFEKTEKAGNAQYFVADAFFKMMEFKGAVVEFDNLLRDYPSNNKIATALLKKGNAQLKVELRKEGEETLRLLMQTYPGTPEAKEAEDIVNQLPPIEKPPTKPTRPRRG